MANINGMGSLRNTHVKLLAFDFLSLVVQNPNSHPISFSRKGRVISRAETLGTVVTRDLKLNKFLKFSVDDGTGCIPCVLWLNALVSPHFLNRRPSDVRLIADTATRFAAVTCIGAVVRVRGRITAFRGELQITVSDVVVERDPNVEMFHWLECIRLARECYDVIPT